MAKSSNARRLYVEQLESRHLMAGDVTAEVIKGSLIIRGDRLDNRLTIEGTAAGEIRVTGDAFTYVNGDTAPLVFKNIRHHIEIRLADGNDRIVLNGLRIGGDLRVLTGGGDDTVLVNNTRVDRALMIKTDEGHDIVNLVAAEWNKKSRVHTGAGDDIVTVECSRPNAELIVDTGRGDDTILNDQQNSSKLISVKDGPGNDSVTSSSIHTSYDFQQGAQGWQAGFADYRAGDEEFFELAAGIRELPPELGPGTGFYIQGNNHSDDLFMFLKRRLGPAEGIEANQAYQVRLTIVFGSNVPTGCFGIGGSPGESVFLKAGASSREPVPVDGEDGFLRLNVDKGNQATGGTAASIVGNVANGIPCDEAIGGNEEAAPPWVSLTRVHIHEYLVQADENGQLWLLVGTDSGFEATTALYYQRIEAVLIPVSSVPASRSEKPVR